MSQELYYLYKRRIRLYYDQDSQITDREDLLLTISNDWHKLLQYKDRFQYEFYKTLEFHLIPDKAREEQLLNFFGKTDFNEATKALETISFADFKRLYATFGVDFTIVKTCQPNQQLFYPLLNHALLNSLGFKTLHHHELEDLVDNLSSTDSEECFEKGLFFLLQNNFIPFFIGDPETTKETAEFFDQYQRNRKKMLLHFGKPENEDLVSKYDCLKFWLIEKSYRPYGDMFNNFFANKREILGENLAHFDELVAFFKNHKEKIIYTVNVC